MNRKFFAMLFVISVLMIPATRAQSRFKNYQSKTQFGNSDDKNNSNQKVDNFGRGTGIDGVSNVPKAKEFVNLNPETAFGPEVVTSFDFPDTSLVDLTKHMQKITGINLILEKDLKGKISIMAPSPITVGDAWKAYLTALNANGYTLVKSGAFYKIVNARDIRYTPTTIYTGSYTPETENYAMRIIPLKHISSADLIRSFRPFMSRYGRINEIKQTNTVIIQDTGSNINRIARLIKFIDVPGHDETLQIIPVKNSSAQEIAKLLKQILKTTGSSRSKVRSRRGSSSNSNSSTFGEIIAETRTNSIIAMTNASGGQQLRALINKLDVKLIASSSGQIHVYYLKHSDSETLSKTLSSLVSGASSSSSSSKRSSRFRSSSSNSTESLFNAQVKITADKDNNALVITASPTDYLTIKGVIDKLDIPKDQVYVEGLIVETSIRDDSEFGISLIGAYGEGAAKRFGVNPSSAAGLFTGDYLNLSGLFAGITGGPEKTIQIGNSEFKVNSVNALLNAISSDRNTNVLATPQILATDNTEAIFEVGESVPTQTSTISNGQTQISEGREKVSLKLKIKPHINKATRFIRLEIDQKVEDFSKEILPGTTKPMTNLRQTITTVNVRDRDTIAMGGLMRDKATDNVQKVPLLGDIPILGWLFKKKTKEVYKTNMLFFLTPRIIDANDGSSAKVVKDVLNRRSEHLKSALGDDDPFGGEMKSLYDKAKKQEQGPLFNTQKLEKFNEGFKSSHTVPGEILDNPDDIRAEEQEAAMEESQPFSNEAARSQELEQAVENETFENTSMEDQVRSDNAPVPNINENLGQDFIMDDEEIIEE